MDHGEFGLPRGAAAGETVGLAVRERLALTGDHGARLMEMPGRLGAGQVVRQPGAPGHPPGVRQTGRTPDTVDRREHHEAWAFEVRRTTEHPPAVEPVLSLERRQVGDPAKLEGAEALGSGGAGVGVFGGDLLGPGLDGIGSGLEESE